MSRTFFDDLARALIICIEGEFLCCIYVNNYLSGESYSFRTFIVDGLFCWFSCQHPFESRNTVSDFIEDDSLVTEGPALTSSSVHSVYIGYWILCFVSGCGVKKKAADRHKRVLLVLAYQKA